MTENFLSNLGMQPIVGDPVLYVQRLNGEVARVSGQYVYNVLNAVNLDFKKLTDLTLKMMNSKPGFYDSFDLFGAQIKTKMDGSLELISTIIVTACRFWT